MSKPESASAVAARITKEPQTASQAAGTDSGEVVEILKGNTTLAVWLVFLGFGGGLLTLYYARIGYLPDIEWNSILIYLASASVIGGGVAILFALSLFVPGFIWQEFLVFDSRISKNLCYTGDSRNPCIRSILVKLGVPFGLAIFGSHIWIRVLFEGAVWGPRPMIAFLIGELLFLGSVSKYMWELFNSMMKPVEEAARIEQLRHTFKYTFWFNLSIFVSQISMLFFYLLSGRPGNWVFWTTTIICTVGVLISNHIVAVRYRNGKRQAVAASLIIASLLLVTADQFSPLSVRVMGYFGFGGNRTFDLVLSSEGATIIQQMGLANCAPQASDRVCGVEILSKVGEEYYLRLNRPDRKLTFTLPKAVVLSRISDEAAK